MADDPPLPDWLNDELTQDKLLVQCAKLKALWPLPENGGVFRESQKIRELKAGLAKLGIDTPAGLPVLRDNLIERIAKGNAANEVRLFDDFRASVDLIVTAIKNSQSAVPKEVPAVPSSVAKPGETQAETVVGAAKEPCWPAGTGWEFRPGEAAFQGRPFAITGKPVVILKRLAEKPGEPVLKSILRGIIDPNSDVLETCVSDNIAEARAILRKAFKLGNSVDPIPNLTRGPNAAWKLDEEVFPDSTKNP